MKQEKMLGNRAKMFFIQMSDAYFICNFDRFQILTASAFFICSCALQKSLQQQPFFFVVLITLYGHWTFIWKLSAFK